MISIILARLLRPDDFGLIAIIMFFLGVSQIFIESGFSRALIQKTNRSPLDYSTVFVFNLILSLLLYLLLFVTAPFIASFYEEPTLTSLIRVLSLTLVLNALVLVENVKLQVKVDFKKIAKINVVSVLGSGLAGVAFAFYGLGVWALVVQSLVHSLLCLVMFYGLASWRISLRFSTKHFRSMWRFSFHLLIAGFVATLTNNIYNLLIGKYFSVKNLGYYHRANNFTILTSDAVSQSIQQVTFPVLSQMQDDKERLVAAYIKMMKISAFIIFPVIAFLSVMAEPIVKVLLNEAWFPAIPLLQWMAFTRLLYPLNALNLNILNATGRSDLFLKVDVSKLPITAIALVLTLPLGVKAMVIGQVICAPLYYLVNTIVPGRLYAYHFFKQVRDVLPCLTATVLLYVVAYFCVHSIESAVFQLLLGGVLGGVTYLIACKLMKVEALREIQNIIRGFVRGEGG